MKGRFVGAFLTDLSEVFDCLKHGLLIAKTLLCGFDNESVNFISAILVKIFGKK